MSATLSRSPPKNAWAKIQYSSTQLGGGTTAQGQTYPGGLDLTTPSLRLQPGALRDALNFEVPPFGGYRRIDGNERYDGRTSPHTATYVIIQMAAGFLFVPSVGDIVTQAVSGATGMIIAIQTASIGNLSTVTVSDFVITDFNDDFSSTTIVGGGSSPDPLSPDFLVLTMVTGAFDNTNLLTIAGNAGGGGGGNGPPGIGVWGAFNWGDGSVWG